MTGGVWPPRDPAPDMRWWEVALGSIAFALATWGLIWLFAILGASLDLAHLVPCRACPLAVSVG